MNNTIRISQMNDFLFCPYSIYLHNIYESLSCFSYHSPAQLKGTQAHQSVDSGRYTTKKSVLTGMPVYSERYGLVGDIDQYFAPQCKQGGTLVERKRTISAIYDGYKLQLYAQYYCMTEMGFSVDRLAFYSMTDNKKYPIALPDAKSTLWFENQLGAIRGYNPAIALTDINPNKCRRCVYRPLCDQAEPKSSP